MPSLAFFIVTSDPRVSARPAEAVRIAAGLGSWKNLDVQLYLRDAAVLALGELAEDLVDGEHFVRYLPLLQDSGQSILVQAGAPLLAELGDSKTTFELLADDGLPGQMANCRYVLRF